MRHQLVAPYVYTSQGDYRLAGFERRKEGWRCILGEIRVTRIDDSGGERGHFHVLDFGEPLEPQ